MPNEVIVGVYLERSGGSVMRAIVTGEDGEISGRKKLEATHYKDIDWDPSNVEEAHEGVRALAKIAASMGKHNLKSVAIAAPGPFLSLRRSNSDGRFGIIHPTVSHLPLRGFNLRQIFHEGISESGGNPNTFITVHTDAEACAIGEAVARNLPDKSTLAFLLVTEGIGLGIVRGRTPLSSALHSEIGVLSVRWDAADPLKPERTDRHYAKSLSEMADNSSLRARYGLSLAAADGSADVPKVTDADLLAAPNHPLWEFRAYYLAQACLACAVILAPHQIVLGADVDVERSIAERTNRQFRAFLTARRIEKQPVFEFDEIGATGYISRSEPIPSLPDTRPFRATGALGMCHAAASAGYGAKHPITKES